MVDVALVILYIFGDSQDPGNFFNHRPVPTGCPTPNCQRPKIPINFKLVTWAYTRYTSRETLPVTLSGGDPRTPERNLFLDGHGTQTNLEHRRVLSGHSVRVLKVEVGKRDKTLSKSYSPYL